MPGSVAASMCEERPGISPDLGLPESYVAVKCQFCGHWSSDLCPWTLSGNDKAKWFPVWPWGDGSKEQPAGLTCRVCIVVPCMHITSCVICDVI